MSEDQNIPVEDENVSSVTDVTDPGVVVDPVDGEGVNEKFLPQSKVNEIVGATRRYSYRKAYGDASKKFEAELQSMADSDARPVHASPEMAKEYTSDDVIHDEVGKQIGSYFSKLEEAKNAEIARQEAEKTLSSLQAKVETASSKYEDFDEVTKDIPYASFPDLLSASDTVDNSGDVLYHLGKHPTKFRELASALSNDNPLRSVAMKELRALSESLKNNESTLGKNTPRSPLSQIQPSNVGADNGKLSRADLRKKYTV